MVTNTKVPVALIDDHNLMRSSLARVIDLFPNYEVVIEAENGLHFQELIPRRPDVSIAVVDLHMPVMDGYDSVDRARHQYVALPGVFTSSTSELSTVHPSFPRLGL